MANKCILKCCENPYQKIILPDMQVKYIGRSKETKIIDKRCSRSQVEFCANYKSYILKATQMGPNPSIVKGSLLHYKKSALLRHGDVIELLEGTLKYAVNFEPAPLQESWKKIFNKDPKMGAKRHSEDEKHGTNKIAKIDNKFEWEEAFGGEILVLNRQQQHGKEKVVAYDMDGTLITTKSGLVFPKSLDDWRILYPEVPAKLQALSEDDYKLVIFTNQAGIATGKQTVEEIQGKISAIIKKIGITAQAIVSTGRGKYRKPMTGMWEYFLKECNGNVPVSVDNCCYVGDAAGRLEVPKQKKKDHSIADRLFALNIGLKFFTPEEHFLGKLPLPFKMPAFDPRNLPEIPLLNPENSEIENKNCPEVMLLVGYPGSGKSHFYHMYLQKHGYVHANRDTLGSWQKCVSVMEKSVKDDMSVVIDNTNPDIESRKRYIDVANKLHVAVRCFLFNVTIEQSMHNNRFRELTGSSHLKVNAMVYNSYRSKYQEPTLDEGFSEIVKVNFVHKFIADQQKQIYCKFLLEK